MAQEHEELEQAEIDAPFSDTAGPETRDRGMKRKARDDGRDGGTFKKQDTNYGHSPTSQGLQKHAYFRLCIPISPTDWEFIGHRVCRVVGCKVFKKVFANSQGLHEDLNNMDHKKFQAHHRKTATGLYEPEPASPVHPAFCDIATPFEFK
ncbi:uncharacterized protein FFM5_04865 [Fusarium fujikuroi]|nr:uncharacterized protein FFM5_04865 [Fusarium fujikuroi]